MRDISIYDVRTQNWREGERGDGRHTETPFAVIIFQIQ